MKTMFNILLFTDYSQGLEIKVEAGQEGKTTEFQLLKR